MRWKPRNTSRREGHQRRYRTQARHHARRAVELGYKDTGALWRSWYDMEPDAFAAKTDALWAQVAPFYKNLHCYVRGR
jgi:hypothetical protein